MGLGNLPLPWLLASSVVALLIPGSCSRRSGCEGGPQCTSALQVLSSIGSERFSVLELAGIGRATVASAVALRFPRATVVSIHPPSLLAQHADDDPPNLYRFGSSESQLADQIRMLHDSPTLFSATLALGITPETFLVHLGKELLGISRLILLSAGGWSAGRAQNHLAAAASAGNVTIAVVKDAGSGLIKVVVGSFERAVRHHFGDNRRCPMRGYWFTYRATPPGTSMPMHPQLERLKYGLGHYAAKKGGVGQKAFGCQYTNQKKGPELTEQSWVNLFTLSGLGLATSSREATRQRLLTLALDLPRFEDGVPWNACVDADRIIWCDMDFVGGETPIRHEALAGVCSGGHDWRELKSPPCILDMMLITIYGCGPAGFAQLRDVWFGGSGNVGHHPKGRPITSEAARECRASHGLG